LKFFQISDIIYLQSEKKLTWEYSR
jgi:hypothetical protein